MNVPQTRCPRCGSTQFTVQRKGYRAGCGCILTSILVGSVMLGILLLSLFVLGPLTIVVAIAMIIMAVVFGVMGGFSGSRKMECICGSCGYSWKPGRVK